MRRLLLLLFSCSLSVYAALQSGSVRAADQFVPGAKVTAHQGDSKVVAYTDENGRYSINLAPGDWDVDVEMLGFTTAHAKISVLPSTTREGGGNTGGGNAAQSKEWTLEMPRYGQPSSKNSALPDAPKPSAAGVRTRQPGQGARGQGGRGFGTRPAAANAPTATAANGAPPVTSGTTATPGARGPAGRGRGDFQSASVTATQEGQDALAQAASQASSLPTFADQPDDSFMVIGSSSGGLAQSSDDEARRQRAMAGGRGGPGGPGGPGAPGGIGGFGGDAAGAALGLPPGMSVTSDSLGLGGLGASAINGGFGGDNGGAGFGGLRRRLDPEADLAVVAAAVAEEQEAAVDGVEAEVEAAAELPTPNRRGPYNGQFASFGNRRRTRPQYTGSVFANLNNSALNAAPFSLNGQPAAEAFLRLRRDFGANFGGPMVIPKLLNWQRASFYLTYQGTLSRNPYNQVSSVPTLAERGGDFSQLLTAPTPTIIYDPTDHQPFPGNIIPAQFLDNAAAAGCSTISRCPPIPGSSRTIATSPRSPTIRKHRRPSQRAAHQQGPAQLQRPVSEPRFRNRAALRISRLHHRLRPERVSRLEPQLRAALQQQRQLSPSAATTTRRAVLRLLRRTSPRQLGITGTSQDPINYGPPNLSFTNFGRLSRRLGIGHPQPDHEFHRRHHLRAASGNTT